MDTKCIEIMYEHNPDGTKEHCKSVIETRGRRKEYVRETLKEIIYAMRDSVIVAKGLEKKEKADWDEMVKTMNEGERESDQ